MIFYQKKLINIKEFAPLSDDLLTDNGNNRENMINKIGEEYTNKMWKLIGGFKNISSFLLIKL